MLLGCLVIWRNFFFYPKVWRAHIVVDGRPCPECAVYVHRTRIEGGVLVRRNGDNTEYYSLAFPSTTLKAQKGTIFKCVDGAFSFVPGLAFHHLQQWCAPGCFPVGQKVSGMNSRLVEFTADDGKCVRAQW